MQNTWPRPPVGTGAPAMREVVCAVCGRIFEASTPRACYCSAECKIAGAKARRLEWDRRNPLYNAEYWRRHSAQARAARRGSSARPAAATGGRDQTGAQEPRPPGARY